MDDKSDKLKKLKAKNRLLLASEVPPPPPGKSRGMPQNLKPRTAKMPKSEVTPVEKDQSYPELPPGELYKGPFTNQPPLPAVVIQSGIQSEAFYTKDDGEPKRTVIQYEDGFYLPVKERMLMLKKEWPVYSLKTNVDYQTATGLVMINAVLTINKHGVVCEYDGIAWGFVAKDGNSRKVAGELQTAAWGRCLAAAGYGIEINIASSDEVVLAAKEKTEPGFQPPLTVSQTIAQNTKDKLSGKKL